jgi:hypothetical protein
MLFVSGIGSQITGPVPEPASLALSLRIEMIAMLGVDFRRLDQREFLIAQVGRRDCLMLGLF